MTDLKFEDCLTRLEQIVALLEGGNLSLEESLKVYEEGVSLARRCAAYLEDADRRIEVLTKDDAGSLGKRPFAWEPEREA